MSLDFYKRKNIDQTKNDYKEIDELVQMDLDPDLKEQLRKDLMELKMEQERLERQGSYNKDESGLYSSPKKSLDTMSFSEFNLTSSKSNSNQINQEEKSITFGQKYSEEELKQAEELREQNIKLGQDIIAMLESAINKNNESDSIEEEHAISHR